MLSWGYNSLLKDGRSLSDLKQGVTLEVFGEGTSAGPKGNPDSLDYISFGQAMNKLADNKVSPNVASFLGAATVRIQHIGFTTFSVPIHSKHSRRSVCNVFKFWDRT